ncbi:DNA mismatch repair protein Mlh3-like, partial [Anneissia japonica]|uniref:DNA mismatch repair protein Mlh3-like n=1 Tax=Anneissia japonica TaxID=1529436 RepID=UPI001425B6BD
MHQYNFTKEMLANAKVLGQLDGKFIACMLHSEGKVEVEPNLLVLLDQHAAHERVRLEKLTSDAIDNSEDGLNEGFSKVRIKSSKLHPPITITFASKEMRLIVGFRDRFKRMGLQMNCAENAVEVTSVPACFVEHDVSEMKHGRKPVTAAVVE